jgi:23S rRNA (guanosine2251-2'-O)-methyltransferase
MSGERVYGLHAVEGVLRKDPRRVTSLQLQRGRRDRRLQTVQALAEAADVPVSWVERRELDAQAGGRHQGALALLSEDAPAQDLRWGEVQLMEVLARPAAEPPLLLVLDGVTDPHNLGACLRSADAAGVLAVIVPKDRSADITPVVRKVACGATESVPLVRVTNLARTLRALKEAGVWVYGAAGEATEGIFTAKLAGPLALVMGAEGSGLRRLTRECCDGLLALPMAGAVSSLNVSVATGIFLFEARRQRLGGSS